MKLKAKYLCQIRFENNWIMPSALMSGFSFFLLIVYYFGIANFTRCGAGEIVFSMILPMLIMVGMMVLLRGIHSKVTPAYGALAAVYCLLLAVENLISGGTMNILQAVLLQIPCIVFALIVTFGFFSETWVMSLVFFLAAVMRLFFTVIPLLFSLQLVELVSCLSALFGFLSFGMLALAFEVTPFKRTRQRPQM